MRILGISCDFHDAAAALVVDGEVVAAAEEERFSRIKHDSSLPAEAMAACLAIGGIEAAELDAVVFHEKPLRVVNRVLAARQRRGIAALGQFTREAPVLVSRNSMIAYRIEKELRSLGAAEPIPTFYGEHHLSHASAAFYPSPFETAAILTVDGIGEWSTATIGQGLRHRIDQLVEQRYPHSLGLLYSLATVWCGFAANDGEYKLMGLAPYGEPTYLEALRSLVDVGSDGRITIDARAVRWWSSKPGGMRKVAAVFGGPPRRPDEELTDRHANIARSMQALTEEAVLAMAAEAHRLTGEPNLCLGGGVALNCVANGRIIREGPFEQVWVQPAPGDAGSAIGAALWYWHAERGEPRSVAGRGPLVDGMAGSRLGPRPDGDQVQAWLDDEGVAHERMADPAARAHLVAERLAAGEVVGWFQGRMEFGPRALGGRSILADPRSATMASELNLRVKGRESFRPFAPAVLWEHAADWFDLDRPARTMSATWSVADDRLVPVPDEPATIAERAKVVRSQIPACTHVDGSARVQTVHADTEPELHRLLEAFHELTGCPILVNTSFNRAGEPIVATPADALATALAAGLDLLVIDEVVIDLVRHRAAEPVSA